MRYVIIKINNPSEEYELIRKELVQYNITPDNVSPNWNMFGYLCYNSIENTITNYSNIVRTFDDSILCSSINEFIKEVKKKLNIKEMEKEFTLGDLKPGMVIEYRNENRRLVVLINNKLHFINDCDYLDNIEDNYKEDLTCIGGRDFDIMKIYRVHSIAGINYLLDISNKELIWERKEIKEYTMQEIADKLGIPVEQLRIKK